MTKVRDFVMAPSFLHNISTCTMVVEGFARVKKSIMESNSASSHLKRRASMARQELNARAAIGIAQSGEHLGSPDAPDTAARAQAHGPDSDSGAPSAEQFGSSGAPARAVKVQAHCRESDSEAPEDTQPADDAPDSPNPSFVSPVIRHWQAKSDVRDFLAETMEWFDNDT